MPEAQLESGARPRVVDNRNDLIADYPWVSGVKTGLHGERGQRARRRRATAPGGARVISVVLGEPTRGGARRRHARAAALGTRPLPPRARARPAADASPRRTSSTTTSSARLVPRRGAVRHHSRRPARPAARECARRGRRARSQAGARVGTVTVLRRREAGTARGAGHGRGGPRMRGHCGCSYRGLGSP